MRNIGVLLLLVLFNIQNAAADSPQWCGNNNYTPGHPLAWEQLSSAVTPLIEQFKIEEAYGVVLDRFDTEMAIQQPSQEARTLRDSIEQYLTYISQPGIPEAPETFSATRTLPTNSLVYELGPLGSGASVAYDISLPCASLGIGANAANRNIAHALWSFHKVSKHKDYQLGIAIAANRATKLYQSYDKYLNNGLPMWPWELWVNGYLVPDEFTAPAPKRQWVFLRPNISPALVTGSDSESELDYGLTLEIGHIWYRNDDYNSWWGLSGMVALTDDQGVGYGGLFRWNDYTLGVARHSKNDDTLVYVSVDLYKFITNKEARKQAASGILKQIEQRKFPKPP